MQENQTQVRQRLVQWINEYTANWKDHDIKTNWPSYMRLFRGKWSQEERTRMSERSKIITPALQQAVEAALADDEEAIFGREGWFDIAEDAADEKKDDWQQARVRLLEDFDEAGVPESISEILLWAKLTGTGLAKVSVEKIPKKKIISILNPKEQTIQDGVATVDQTIVRLIPIDPNDFEIDPSVSVPGKEGIQMATGMYHTYYTPRYGVVQKQND